MAVYLNTSNPTGLLSDFKAAIKQQEAKGKIDTWELDPDGDITHRADQWARKLWFRPVVEPSRLAFYTLPPTGKVIATVDYGYYHGHLIVTFLNHFDGKFSQAIATAQPAGKDSIGKAT